MDKEELEKEAEDFLQKKWGTSEMLILGGDARKVLADFAEPREKRIEELEKENAELKSGCGMCYRKDKEQLTKAKEIIKNLLFLHNDKFGSTRLEWRCNVVAEAEQFLNEVEK